MDGRGLLAAGHDALARGEWAAARASFLASWEAEESPDALDGLGRALWWLDDPASALEVRGRAFGLLRRDNRDAEAAAVAIWIARQYRSLYRQQAMADGWLARARSLVNELGCESRPEGWLRFAESEATANWAEAAAKADEALAVARQYADTDLEIVALARRGACAVVAGRIKEGLSHLHEAMTAATSGEGTDVQYIGEALCTLLEVSGWLGDPGMVEPWAALLADFRASYAFGPLIPFQTATPTDLISAFCTGCCGGVYLVTGRLDAAEEQLVRAVREMATTGRRPRCLHPVARLADLRVLQGRLQEAEALLTGFDADWECAPTISALDLALGQPKRAVARLTAALDMLGDAPVLAVPVRAQLVDAALALGEVAVAVDSSKHLARMAAVTGSTLHQAHSNFASGKIALATGREASVLLHTAAGGFAEAGAPLLACRARLALAQSLVTEDRGHAVTEARSALQALDGLGATADADRAAAFLRELGVKGRTGPRHVGVLSRREQEVLRLVAEGLSNSEIAERLFITTKTAGHHVSSILMKLGLRSRTEAAAFALLNLPRDQQPGRHDESTPRIGNAPHAGPGKAGA